MRPLFPRGRAAAQAGTRSRLSGGARDKRKSWVAFVEETQEVVDHGAYEGASKNREDPGFGPEFDVALYRGTASAEGLG